MYIYLKFYIYIYIYIYIATKISNSEDFNFIYEKIVIMLPIDHNFYRSILLLLQQLIKYDSITLFNKPIRSSIIQIVFMTTKFIYNVHPSIF